jgi:hypothetical protein
LKCCKLESVLPIMTSPVRLVSGGDTLSIWESSGYTHVYTYYPTSGSKRIVNNSWNFDGSCIASCVEGSDNLVLTHFGGTSFTSAEYPTTLGVTPIRVQFPRTSLKLLVVGSVDKVKKKSIIFRLGFFFQFFFYRSLVHNFRLK